MMICDGINCILKLVQITANCLILIAISFGIQHHGKLVSELAATPCLGIICTVLSVESREVNVGRLNKMEKTKLANMAA